MASTSDRSRSHKLSLFTEYQTMRPDFCDETIPARASTIRCRATTEKSTEQHSAISDTEHGRQQRKRHDNNFTRVPSASALKNSGSRARSTSARRRAAWRGVAMGAGDATWLSVPAPRLARFLAVFAAETRFCCLVTCVIMQMMAWPSEKSNQKSEDGRTNCHRRPTEVQSPTAEHRR